MSAAASLHRLYSDYLDKEVLDLLIRHMGVSEATSLLKNCEARRDDFYNENKNRYEWAKDDRKRVLIHAADLSTQCMNRFNNDPKAAQFAADVTKYLHCHRKSFAELSRDINRNGVEKEFSEDQIYSFVESYRFLNQFYLSQVNELPQKETILRHFRAAQNGGMMDQLLAQPMLQCIPEPARKLYALMGMLMSAIKKGAGSVIASRIQTEGEAACTNHITYNNTH